MANRRVTGRLLRDGTAEITSIVSAASYAAIMGSPATVPSPPLWLDAWSLPATRPATPTTPT